MENEMVTEREIEEWRDALKAFLALETADVRKSDVAKAAMNRLANAEDALYRAALSAIRTPPAGEVVAYDGPELGDILAMFPSTGHGPIDKAEYNRALRALANMYHRKPVASPAPVSVEVTDEMVERAARAEYSRVMFPTIMPEHRQRELDDKWRFYEADARRWLTAALSHGEPK